MDIYFDQTEVDKAIDDIVSDVVFHCLPMEQNNEVPQVAATNATAPPTNAFELRRKMMDPEFGSDLIISRDFIMKRQNEDSFRLCEKCPQPPSTSASYIISCPEHNKN